ncbi:MAG: M4 family metallopeptidase [Segetibacter sp.]
MVNREDITKVSPKFLRSMSNPNAGYQPQPDTYEGKYWHSQSDPHDNYGVHTNSGVLNYWFYLLSQGGSGTNDKGKFYSVASITIEKAAKIAYRTLRDKLAPNDNYAIACTKSIEAAKELYGSRSAEAIAVNNAWYAVGVAKYLIIPPPPTPKNFTSTVFSTNQINLKWSDVLLESSYTILYTTKNPYLPTSGIVLMQSINVSANVTTFESKNLNPGTTYYYRIKASNGSGSSPYSAWIKATTFIPIVARKSNAEEQLEKTSLSKAFFPNPAKDKVTVDLSLYKGIPITIFIYDLTGRLHRSFSETANHSSQIQINVSHLIPGAYLLRVQTPTSFKSYKLIKE